MEQANTNTPVIQPQYYPVQNMVVPTPMQQESWTLKEKLVYSLIGLVVVGGTIFVARKMVLNRKADKEANKSFDDGSDATYATQIKMAFENDGWPGTNTNALRTVLRQISSKDELKAVAKSYENHYHQNMYDDMKSELQSTEYNEMLQILAAKPQKKGTVSQVVAYEAWAKRMKAAFDKVYGPFPGTDSDAIVAVFNEIPTQAVFVQVAARYKMMYGTNMLDDLKSESEFGQYDNWMKIITSKPQ
jgi:hypothetical protein